MRIILAACTSLIMHMQACSCMRMILPSNPNPNFSNFVSIFTCNASILDPFSYIHGFELLFHMLVCLFDFHMSDSSLSCVFLFWCHEHTFTHSSMNAIGAKFLQGKWGKSCICLWYDLVYAWWYNYVLIALGGNMICSFYFHFELMIHDSALDEIWWYDNTNMLGFMLSHVRWMLG